MATCPDVDNSWVLAGSENLPVETLGPESRTDPESEKAAQPPQGPLKADGEALAGTKDGEEIGFQTESPHAGPDLPEETKAEGTLGGDPTTVTPDPGDTAMQEDLQDVPVTASLDPDTQDLEDLSCPQSLPSTPKAAWTREEGLGSSTEDDTDLDVEGLRRRRGREPSLPQRPLASLDVEEQARDEGSGGELGISLNMCLLGALVLLGLGILLFSGGLWELETGPMEETELQVFPDTGSEPESAAAAGDGQDGPREQLQASVSPDSVPSLQNMGLLLDKLAKENQDIRLLQAQLQAQKEELQSLLQQPKGLEEENARLRGALQQGEASQRLLESELRQLRARLQGLEANCERGADGVCLSWGRGPQGGRAAPGPDPSFLEQKARLEAEAQALRQQLQQQRRLLGSVQQDLQRGLREAGRGAPAHAGLAELGHRLVQTLQGLQKRGQDPPGGPANASEPWHQKPRFQSSREASGKEKWQDGRKDRKAEHWKQRKEESGGERKKSWGGESDRDLEGRWREGTRQDHKEPPRKSGSPHSHSEGRLKHARWGQEARDGPDPPRPWEELARHKFRAPQGCSGVAACARQEGLAFFGRELAPVGQQELASVLRAYLARLPWAGPLTKELPFSPTYFGEDGVFRHDRLRFRDFVDALEDSLEEVAVRQTGDDDEVDDFEDFVFSHFFGDKALRKRSGKKDKHSRSPRDVGPREEHGRHPHYPHHHHARG